MNRNINSALWKQIRGRVREQWGRLTDDEIEQLHGRYDELVGKVQEKYGKALNDAAREVNAFLDQFNGHGPRKTAQQRASHAAEPGRSRSTQMLNELIEVARDGERFYMDAANKVHSRELGGVFRQMADVRQLLIDELSRHVLARGDVPSGDQTFSGAARKVYADVRATLAGDADGVYLARLEEAEDRLLQRYQKALRQAPTPEIAAILKRHEPTVWAAHDRMKALRDRFEAAI